MKQRKQGRRTHTVFYVVGILFLLAIVGVWVFSNTHFLRGTFIGGVDCSYLTVDDALNKVQQEAGEYTNKLYFIDEATYDVKNCEIGVVFEQDKFESIFKRQHDDKNVNRV